MHESACSRYGYRLGLGILRTSGNTLGREQRVCSAAREKLFRYDLPPGNLPISNLIVRKTFKLPPIELKIKLVREGT
jgi:hypothetical protein